MDTAETEVLTTESRAIPSRRIVVNDPGQLPIDYSTTPGGTIFSTTPGGELVCYCGCFYTSNIAGSQYKVLHGQIFHLSFGFSLEYGVLANSVF